MKKFIIILILVLIPVTAFAETTAKIDLEKLKEDALNSIEKASLSECKDVLVPAFDLETLDFLNFLEETFQNKSSNSSLANTAIMRYSQFKKEIQRLFDKLGPNIPEGSDSTTYTEELKNYSACKQLRDTYISLAKKKMVEQIKITSSEKETAIFMEKYKAINDQLRELNMQIAKMYASFVTFMNKSPGFLQECVKSAL